MLDYMLQYFSFLPLPREQLKKGLTHFLKQQLAWCDDPDFSACFPFKETHQPQQFFQQKIIESERNTYLTGPRYINRNIHEPFIELVASSAPLTAKTAEQIFKTWQPLKAKAIRVLRRANTQNTHDIGQIDQFIYARELSDNQAISTLIDKDCQITQASASDLKWCMQTIESAYQDTFLKLPQLRSRLEPSQTTTVQDAINNGDVFIIHYQQIPAGLLIHHFHTYAFIPGYWVDEKVILPEFRGRHLAAIAQNQLCRELSNNGRSNLLLGCIAGSNLPSIRSAQVAGRTALLEYAFLTSENFS